MNFSGIFGHIVNTTGLILAFLIIPHGTPVNNSHAQVKPTAFPTGSISEHLYVATGQYTYQGHAATFRLFIPKSGGDVSGTIAGDCNGIVAGVYDGGDNGKIQGKINATCHVYFLSIPATGTYTGVVNAVDKTVNVNVDVKADGFEKSQQVSLLLH